MLLHLFSATHSNKLQVSMINVANLYNNKNMNVSNNTYFSHIALNLISHITDLQAHCLS